MIIEEKTVSTKEIFKGNILTFKVDTVELKENEFSTRELVCHPGGVAVIPIDDSGYVYMVRQFRKPYDEVILEIPAGKKDVGEDSFFAAKRELSEETGLCADSYTYLGEFYPSPGYTNEIINIYLAQNLKIGKSHPDDDEYVDIEKIHIDILIDMIMKNEIKDGKSISAILKAKMLLSDK